MPLMCAFILAVETIKHAITTSASEVILFRFFVVVIMLFSRLDVCLRGRMEGMEYGEDTVTKMPAF